MKKIELDLMWNIQGGNKDIDAFMDGLACGYGLATLTTGILGIYFTIKGCHII